MRYFLLVFLAGFVGCASAPRELPAGPGAAAPAPARKSFYGDRPYYVDPASFELALVPPPPKVGSTADKRDLAELDRAQRERTDAQCAAVRAQEKVDFHTFHARLPFVLDEKANDFFWRLRSDTGQAVGKVKHVYLRPRPFVRDAKRFVPCYSEKHGTSYPSGHATIARVFARVLADLDSANAAVYLREGDVAARNRVIGGVHYPSDIQAGVKFGDVIYERIRSSPAFQKDFAELKAVSTVKQ